MFIFYTAQQKNEAIYTDNKLTTVNFRQFQELKVCQATVINYFVTNNYS